MAVLLSRKVVTLMHPTAIQPQMPPQSTPVETGGPLPEAPASVNVHVTIGGRDCQLTLRDHDEGRLLARLAQVLAQYPLPVPAASPAPPQEGRWCHMHQVTMHLNHGKDGRQWWSHRRPEGGFCKGK